MLELLPVVSVLLVLIFGVIECSYTIWQLEVVTALSREGSNIASRNNVALSTAVTTVVNDGAVLNLVKNGEVIITAVQNQGGTFKITDQFASTPTGTFTAISRIGTGVGSTVTLLPDTPATSTTLPLNGTVPLDSTVYVTEVFESYVPITPIGAFVKVTLPSTIYDAAYF